MLRALSGLSEGRRQSAEALDAARQSREEFLRRSCVRFVVVNKSLTSQELYSVAVDALRLTREYEDPNYIMLTPRDPPACDPPLRRRVLARE